MPIEARAGRRLAGYRIQELIGRGGMGVVYRAEHLHLRRTVALKLLAPELAENEGFRERFARESRIAASIPHPNIVPVYDAGEADELLYIAMRYIEGSDLATLLSERRLLDPSQALWILRQAGSALDAAHQQGLVHRDVKPGNVLLDSNGAYLSDFGLTKPTTARTPYTVPGQLVGTINYVAPEQIRGDDLGRQTDVYALACVLYECLAGEVPYPRESEIAALYAHLQDPPPALSARRPDLAPLDEPLARALAKDPGDRYSTCGELVSAAHEALGEMALTASEAPTLPGSPLPQRPRPRRSLTSAITRLPAAPGWPARAPTRAALVAAGVVAAAAVAAVLVVALAGSGHKGSRAEPAPPRPKPTPSVPPEVVVTSVATGPRPAAVAVGLGGVWVADSASGRLTHLDPVSGTITGVPVRVGPAPVAVAEHSHTVFVASAGDSAVRKLDALSEAPLGRPIPIGHVPRAIAVGVGDSSVWVAAADGTVLQLGRSARAPVAAIHVGGSLRGIATARGEAWITRADGTVLRLDTRRGRLKQPPIRVGRRPTGIAVGFGVVWVANEGDGTVSRLSVRSGAALGPPTRVGRGPAGVAVGEGYVWVTNSRDGTVTRLVPPGGQRAGAPVRAGRRPVSVRIGAGSVWVANRGSGSVTRIQPLGARPITGTQLQGSR
jgi:serine/threonine protein kinase/DNA-binding beta-propeller fold protein YncE